MLFDIYKTQGKFRDALEMHELFKRMEDSLNNTATQKAAMQYEQEKKDAVAAAIAEQEKALSEEKSRKQNIIIWSVVAGLLLVVVFAGFIFRSLRITRKQKQIIEVQKTEVEQSKHVIEEKNKDITDSINYAKRIQKAMLPHRKDIWTAFPQSFVLFKPKDIVSGDFYFFHKNGQTAFIASADCTGHGVPGAFMSMVGAGKLNDAVAQSTDTSEILSLLNKGIKSALKQSETDESATRDGMDIALCSVDTNARIVKYAGANRPIWIIRKGSAAVEEIKATKKAIGGFTEDSQHFDSHEIQFEKGDTFYISTDGFADTFGGNEAKKVTTKRFKEILVSIQDKTMKEQEHHLDSFIEKWKGGTEQIDDILVIGVRL
jgi:serine phosphatase RsbU (regulator of sigma subunit)